MQDLSHDVPYDIWSSSKDIVIIIPLGGVQKSSISLKYNDHRLLVKGQRLSPSLDPQYTLQQSGSFWGDISLVIDLPPDMYREKIHSRLSAENILIVTLPRRLDPEDLTLDIVYE